MKLIKQRHPELYDKIGGNTQYRVVDGNIIDAYKNIIHVMLLEKIPGFKNLDDVRVTDALEDVYDKYGIPHDIDKVVEVKNELKKIVDRHCQLSNELGIFK